MARARRNHAAPRFGVGADSVKGGCDALCYGSAGEAPSTRAEFDAHCAALHATTHVVQWGGASVSKIGGKIFAICSTWGEGEAPRISFKCSDLAFDVLRDQPGARPAPYLGRYRWIQLDHADALTDAQIRDHIDAACEMVLAKLPVAQRAALARP